MIEALDSESVFDTFPRLRTATIKAIDAVAAPNNQKFVACILITLEKPTKPMREEAADAGRYTSKFWHDKDYPKIQILTIEGLLDGTERVEAPPQLNPFAKAQREAKPEKQQEML